MQVYKRIRGSKSESSPYISITDPLLALKPKMYGRNKMIVEVKKLQKDILRGKVKGTEVISHKETIKYLEDIVKDRENKFIKNPTGKNARRLKKAREDLEHARRDGEMLIKGTLPKKYYRIEEE